MSSLLRTLWRTVILEDTAYHEWRERSNLFLRGIVLILVISLIAGLSSFVVNFVQRVRPVDADAIEGTINEVFEQQFRWNPGFQEPEVREMMEGMTDVLVPMIVRLSEIRSPLPRGISGFFEAVGLWLTSALSSIGGWLFYGALVLIAVNLLGGSAKLPDFLGMVSLYAVPGLLSIFSPVPCVGGLLGLVGTVWGLVVYVKSVAVTTDLDIGKSVVAVLAPLVLLVLLGVVLAALFVLWMVLIF